MIKIITGCLVLIGSLWFGGWITSLFPYGSAYAFAAFATALSMTIGGFVLIIWGAESNDND